MFNNLDFLKAHPAFDKLEIIKKGTYYTIYRPKTDSDRDCYKTLFLQYFKNFVILIEYGCFIDHFIIIERNYFDNTKAHNLKEKCYRFLPKLDEDNSSRPQDGDLLDEKKYWSILNDSFVQEIEICYRRIIDTEDTHTSSYRLVSGGILHTRAIATLFNLLSALENIWNSFKALNIVKRTRFLPISSTNFPHITSKDYLEDTNINKLSDLKEVILLNDDESSYRYFYPEDVEAEKERRRKEAAARKKEREQERKEYMQLEAREWVNFGYYAAMVDEGELAPDDPRYPF
ncbi:hypothetical protein [Anabaena sp. CA = ATCC 33047]|uniref:Ribulose 1,5-bisphosphate carboxylase/oxygenase small subunit (rbcS) gene and rbcX n=1 Tax=Anabaena sp. TaxID=1167 RepID=Q44214_9NOST|nr:hypothetical protein [Anabaena sp. CA = ATCC 33047]pir/I39689/ hypothetical protein 2 - Anabaena sp [Anabaena sp.]AAA63606.1 orf2 [Anabaena sp. CA = ATCC 33047]